ncbi:MAG: tetratricopeptide repeat protein [Alteromonadaceae bacterium]
MSVINQMLKDLDQRQVEQQGSSNFTVPVSSPSSNKKLIFISLIVVILLNVSGIFVWQMYTENQTLKMSNTGEKNPVANKLKLTTARVNEDSKQTSKSSHWDKSPAENELNQNDLNPKMRDNIAQSKTTPESNAPLKSISRNTINQNDKAVVPTNVINNNSSIPKKLADPIVKAAKKSTLKISRKQLSPRALAKQKLIRAEQALNNNNIAQAETLFEDVLLVMPEHKSARKQLAALWFGRQAYSDALNLLSQGIHLSPNDNEFRLMKARVYLQQNRVQQGFTTLNNMPGVNEVVNVEYQSLRATTAQQLNEFSFAAQAYQILVNIEPSAARWWLGLAVAHDSNSEFEQASNAYKTALNKSGLSGSAETFARQRITELGE